MVKELIWLLPVCGGVVLMGVVDRALGDAGYSPGRGLRLTLILAYAALLLMLAAFALIK